MSLDLKPNEDVNIGTEGEDHGVQHTTGYGFNPVGETKETCKEKADKGGGLVYDVHAQACWPLYGKVIKIEDKEYDIQEGFEVVNFNFHVQGTQAPVPSQNELPGIME